jgi:hypothetical protein
MIGKTKIAPTVVAIKASMIRFWMLIECRPCYLSVCIAYVFSDAEVAAGSHQTRVHDGVHAAASWACRDAHLIRVDPNDVAAWTRELNEHVETKAC